MKHPIWLETYLQFDIIGWNDVAVGELVYYRILESQSQTILTKDCQHIAHGPFWVLDKSVCTLESLDKIIFKFKNIDNLEFLKINLSCLNKKNAILA